MEFRPLNEAEKADNSISVVKVEEKKMTVTCKSKSFSAFDKVSDCPNFCFSGT